MHLIVIQCTVTYATALSADIIRTCAVVLTYPTADDVSIATFTPVAVVATTAAATTLTTAAAVHIGRCTVAAGQSWDLARADIIVFRPTISETNP